MKKWLLSLSLVLAGVLGLTSLAAQPVLADEDVCSGPFSDEIKEAAGCNTSTTVDSVINNVLSVVTGFMGIIAVCVMIYGGVQYTISAGDMNKVTRAKHIIIYGVVGLVVSLLAFVIVRFVSGIVG